MTTSSSLLQRCWASPLPTPSSYCPIPPFRILAYKRETSSRSYASIRGTVPPHTCRHTRKIACGHLVGTKPRQRHVWTCLWLTNGTENMAAQVKRCCPGSCDERFPRPKPARMVQLRFYPLELLDCWMYLLCTPHNLATSRRPRNRSMQCMQPRRCLLHSILPAAVCPLVFNVPCRPRSSTLMRSATPPSTSRNTTGIRDGGVPAADATSRRAFDTTTRSLLCPASRMAGCLQCEIYCSWPSPPIGKPKGG
jgi:hypothetical protein